MVSSKTKTTLIHMWLLGRISLSNSEQNQLTALTGPCSYDRKHDRSIDNDGVFLSEKRRGICVKFKPGLIIRSGSQQITNQLKQQPKQYRLFSIQIIDELIIGTL